VTTTMAIDGTTVSIRPFARGDTAAVSAFAAALPEHDLLFLSRDIQHSRVIQAWYEAIDAGELESLIAVQGDTVVATTAIVKDPLSWSPHVAEIRLLVAPSMRGKGLGRALLEASIRLAVEGGATKLTARMTPDQRGAITLFEESGFRGEAMLRDHVKDRSGTVHDLAILSLDAARADGVRASYLGAE
jgi:RimJ/RimL family protein N-acetyltransferase